jgi:hypothetical protein
MAFYIEHRLGVTAPANVIWSILADIEAWPSWAPMYRKASGSLRIGEKITVELVLPGEAPETVGYTVLDWAPDMQIHLTVKLYGGLLTITRYLEIEKLSDVGCIFSNGEIFKGLAVRFMPRKLKAAIRQGFVQASEGLKTAAEAAWREQTGATT